MLTYSFLPHVQFSQGLPALMPSSSPQNFAKAWLLPLTSFINSSSLISLASYQVITCNLSYFSLERCPWVRWLRLVHLRRSLLLLSFQRCTTSLPLRFFSLNILITNMDVSEAIQFQQWWNLLMSIWVDWDNEIEISIFFENRENWLP